MKKNENKSSIENAIQFLVDSRQDINKKLEQQDVELIRNSDDTLSLVNKDTREIQQKFYIKFIENENHKYFNGAYNLLTETFDQNELDPKGVMIDQMHGLRYGYPIQTGAKAVIFTVLTDNISKNQNGKNIKEQMVVGVLEGALIPLQDDTDRFTGECIFMIFYLTSKKDTDLSKNYSQYEFERELIISAYNYAKVQAESKKMKLIGAAEECTHSSRNFYEKMEWRRAYVQKKKDANKKWKEVSYTQPPLAFDVGTGLVKEGSGDAPEHFMINLFNQNSSSGTQINEQLIRIVNGLYKTNNYIPPEVFGLTLNKKNNKLTSINPNSDTKSTDEAIKAYKQHIKAINPLLYSFSKQLNDSKIRFLTESEINLKKINVANHSIIESIISTKITKEADVVLLLAGYEKTTSSMKGTSKGPKKVLEMLNSKVELFDRNYKTIPSSKIRIGKKDLGEINSFSPEKVYEKITSECDKLIKENKFIFLLGGEHSVSLGHLKALSNKIDPKEVTMVQIDAHCDLRDDDSDYSKKPSKLAHSCVARRAHEMGYNIVQIGVRTYSIDEYDYFMNTKNNIRVFEWGVGKKIPTIDEIIESIKTKYVYITIDIDGFDPRYMPGTGTPVQGGIKWWYGVDLIESIMHKKETIGADIVEVSPIKDSVLTEYGAAQLCYTMIAHKFRNKLL